MQRKVARQLRTQGRLQRNSGRQGGCNATHDAQDAQDAKTMSPMSGRNDDASDFGNIFAAGWQESQEEIWT